MARVYFNIVSIKFVTDDFGLRLLKRASLVIDVLRSNQRILGIFESILRGYRLLSYVVAYCDIVKLFRFSWCKLI